jgi:hypothetical protein
MLFVLPMPTRYRRVSQADGHYWCAGQEGSTQPDSGIPFSPAIEWHGMAATRAWWIIAWPEADLRSPQEPLQAQAPPAAPQPA